MEITFSEYMNVRKLLQPYLREDFLTNPKTGIDKAVAIMLGWEVRFLAQKAKACPPLLPVYESQAASSTPPSSSSSDPQLNYVV